MIDDENTRRSKTLKSAIRQQVAQVELSEEQLNALMTVQNDLAQKIQPATEEEQQSNFRRWLPNLLMASFLAVVMGVYTFSNPSVDHTRDIALEVIENHIKLKPLEVSTQSFNEVQVFFDKLDFMPSQSNFLESGWQLNERQMLGGRYCSISGDSAAQLRFKNNDQIYTLYEVGYDEKLFGKIPAIESGEKPKEVIINGLKASLWVEKGLLMVLVTEA